MDRNVKIAKELVKLAKSLVASDGYAMICNGDTITMDSYEQGTCGSPRKESRSMSVNDVVLSGCVRKAVEACGFTMNDVDYAGAEGDGILLVRFVLNEEGKTPSRDEYDAWRRGRGDLFQHDYRWSVQSTSGETVPANEIENAIFEAR